MGRVLFAGGKVNMSGPGILPSGYTLLEYIQSSGTQYIDTGYMPNPNTRIICDFQYATLTEWGAVFGTANGAGNNSAYLFLYANYSSAYFHMYYFNTEPSVSINLAPSDRHTVDCNKNVITLDETSMTTTARAVTSTYPLYLFVYNAAGTVSNQASVKIFSCKIYDNDIIVRDFIPCINPDGEIGMYDLVNKTFYANAGTGSFIGRKPATDSDVGMMSISYSGDMEDAGVVIMSDGEYRLLTLTSSGTLTVDEEVNAEVWMCSGGGSGLSKGYIDATDNVYGGPGGAGGYAASGSVFLSGSMVASIGAGSSGVNKASGGSSFGGISAAGVAANSIDGGTGGGGAGGVNNKRATAGTGDGLSKYPFGDNIYFPNPHCAGGGGGGYCIPSGLGAGAAIAKGGAGGTNGGNGTAGEGSYNSSSYGALGGAGGAYGGGAGAPDGDSLYGGHSATFYGGGGGGAGLGVYTGTSNYIDADPGAGYQGVIYIRIPVDQAS